MTSKTKSTEYTRALFQRRRDAGLCYRCGKYPTEGGKMCPSCTEKSRRYSKEQKELRKALGLCVTCGKREAAKGRFSCPDCLDRFRTHSIIWYNDNKERQKANVKARQERLKAEGRCYMCGGIADRGNGVLCYSCCKKTNKRLHKHKQKMRLVTDAYCKRSYEVVENSGMG